jgi:CxxC motif-containing protein
MTSLKSRRRARHDPRRHAARRPRNCDELKQAIKGEILKEKLICIICPIGCELTVEHDEKAIESVDGNRCKRGLEYAQEEIFDPKRIVTTTVRIVGASVPLLPVRTDRSVSKGVTFEVVRIAASLETEAPVQVGEILVSNIAGSGANLVSTRNLEADHRDNQ